jgi:hypothetical protein
MMVLPDTYQRTQRISQVAITDHINLDASYTDRAFDSERYMVPVITNPNRHLFTTFEDGSFNQERLELDSLKLAVFCFDGFLSHIADIHIEDLLVEKEIKWYPVAILVPVEVNIP